MADPPGAPLAAWLAACAKRDRAAFARLYQATSAKLYGVALRILRREDWAEEVLQECYVSIWTHAPDYRPGLAAPMTWMTSIVRNRCLDWLRRPRLELADEDGALTEAAESDSPGPLAELERTKDAAALARCLRRARGAPAAGDRARLLRRPVARRAGEPPARAARHGEDLGAPRPAEAEELP